MILAQIHRGQSTSATHLFFFVFLPLNPVLKNRKIPLPNLLFFGLNFMGGGGSEKVWTKDILSFFFMEDLPNVW